MRGQIPGGLSILNEPSSFLSSYNSFSSYPKLPPYHSHSVPVQPLILSSNDRCDRASRRACTSWPPLIPDWTWRRFTSTRTR